MKNTVCDNFLTKHIEIKKYITLKFNEKSYQERKTNTIYKMNAN